MATSAGMLPTSFDFIICEDLREEPNRKLTLLGTYIGSRIAVPGDTKKAILNLTLVWIFDDGQGTFAEYGEITGPDGFRIVSPKQIAEKPANGAHAFVMQMRPAPPMSVGKYVARVFLDSRPYERVFEILLDPTLQSSPPRGSLEILPPKTS